MSILLTFENKCELTDLSVVPMMIEIPVFQAIHEHTLYLPDLSRLKPMAPQGKYEPTHYALRIQRLSRLRRCRY